MSGQVGIVLLTLALATNCIADDRFVALRVGQLFTMNIPENWVFDRNEDRIVEARSPDHTVGLLLTVGPRSLPPTTPPTPEDLRALADDLKFIEPHMVGEPDVSAYEILGSPATVSQYTVASASRNRTAFVVMFFIKKTQVQLGFACDEALSDYWVPRICHMLKSITAAAP